MIKTTGFILTATLFLCASLFAQDGRFDVNLNFTGDLPRATTGNNIIQRPTSSGGFLATAAMRIVPKVSLQANWGTTYDSQKYQTGTLFYQITSDVREFTGGVVVHPFQHGRWEPFLLGGGGILSFGPTSSTIDGITTAIGAVRQIQPTVLYGAGADYRLSPHVAFRLQYRGLFYQPPDFKVPTLFSGGRGHMAEPAIGIAINF